VGDAGAEEPLASIPDLDDVNHSGFFCVFRPAVTIGGVRLLLHVVRETGRQRPTVDGPNVRDSGSAVDRSLDGVLPRFARQQLFSRQDQLSLGDHRVAIAVGDQDLLIRRD